MVVEREDSAMISCLKDCHAKEEATYFSFVHLFNKYLSACCVFDTRDLWMKGTSSFGKTIQ